MADRVTFLHLTDAHVSEAGVAYARDDAKISVPAVPTGTREGVLTELFIRFGEHLERTGGTLDGVIFSGDAQNRGDPGGHERVYQLLVDHLGRFGITAGRIVATPGNHDLPRDSAPGSPERYAGFTKVWRDAGCVVPWLDGVDPFPLRAGFDRHRLVAADASWAVFPVNTSNWSNVTSILPEPLRDVWDHIPEACAPADKARAEKLRSQLQSLARYDMARLSENQLEVLRGIMRATPRPRHGRQLRIAVMHHHLRSPSLREELKPFPDISNLEQVRRLLREGGIDAVVHGHKHEHAAYYDYIHSNDVEDAHRTLVISGATFDVGREHDAMRLITVTGLPHLPTVVVEPLPLPRAGAEWRPGASSTRRLWAQIARRGDPVTVMQGAPTVIEGSDIDEVYARARAAASSDAARGTLIVHLDLDQDETALPLPSGYPFPATSDGDLRDRWIRDLVAWWQLERSQLEHRIPYVHGSRLRRYGGKIDQIKRIINLLREQETTRAVAVLLDPFRDFSPDGAKEEFASFCLVEFRRRTEASGGVFIDAIAFYRAQEFARWWPINVAELRVLQQEIGSSLGFKPGRITTIAADARTIARSPTQVAMPIVDRWLDQAPERLHLLADALVYRSVRSEEQRRAVAEWRRALVELRTATEAFNNDGVPIAIEGLRRLATYIGATAESSNAGATAIARELRELADHNERYDRTKREVRDFDLWAPTARRHVDELERSTTERLGPPPGSGVKADPDAHS